MHVVSTGAINDPAYFARYRRYAAHAAHAADLLTSATSGKQELNEPAFSIFSVEAKRFPLILTLDQNGIPHRWITWQHAVWYYAKERIAWETGTEAMRRVFITLTRSKHSFAPK